MNCNTSQIVVGYDGGYGGDYFSMLLYSNFMREYQIEPYKQVQPHNKIFNNHYKHIYNPAIYSKVIKNLSIFLQYCYLKVEKNNKNVNKLKKIFFGDDFNYFFDVNPNNVIDNISSFFNSTINYNIDNVTAIHYFTSPPGTFKNFTFEKVYPNSIKFRLVSNKFYRVLFQTLSIFKNKTPLILQQDYQVLNNEFNTEFLEPLEDFIDIDSGKLFFEDVKYIEQIEKKLSEILNKNINLKKNHIINTYKIKNHHILSHILGPNYLNNSIEKNIDLQRNYFIKNNKYFS